MGDRRVPSQPRTSSSDSDPLHHRPITDRSPKLGDRRSPRGSQSDPVNQKKLGTRIAGLESQLEQAQEELKILKDQLASAEAAKKEAQQELEKKTKKPKKEAKQEVEKKPTKPAIQESEAKLLEKHSHPSETQKSHKTDEYVDDDQQETDVFEVPVQKETVEAKVEIIQPTEPNELDGTKLVNLTTESPAIPEPEKPIVDELALKNDEINLLKANMEVKEKELEVLSQENETLKVKLNDTTSEISSAQVKEVEMQSRLNQLGEELETSKDNIVQLNQKLGAVEGAKEALEIEMKKLRVQTEQWRKAADAAAAVLAGGVEVNGRRISERCGSMDKHYGSAFEAPAGKYAGFVGSPGLGDNDSDDGFGSGKRKGSGIRMFGDLWKKKSQK